MRDPHYTHKHEGIRVEWYVCDTCIAKLADRGWAAWVMHIIGAAVVSLLGYFHMCFVYGGAIYLIVMLWMGLWEKLKEKQWYLKTGRDEVLRNCFSEISKRQDFIATYGVLQPSDEPMTRSALGEI